MDDRSGRLTVRNDTDKTLFADLVGYSWEQIDGRDVRHKLGSKNTSLIIYPPHIYLEPGSRQEIRLISRAGLTDHFALGVIERRTFSESEIPIQLVSLLPVYPNVKRGRAELSATDLQLEDGLLSVSVNNAGDAYARIVGVRQGDAFLPAKLDVLPGSSMTLKVRLKDVALQKDRPVLLLTDGGHRVEVGFES